MHSYVNSQPTPPIMQGSPPPPDWRVPRIDWDRPPWNRWSFQHIQELLPTAPVRRGTTVSPLADAHESIEDITFEAQHGPATIAEWIDYSYSDGLLILKDGKIAHESYWNGMQPHTLHLVQSVSKSITATAAAPLIEEGLLDPSAPVTEPLPELAHTAWAGASLQQVMDMTSGVRFDETDYANRASDIGKMDVASGWKPVPEGYDHEYWPSNIWDQILSMQVKDAEHGARFQYRSIETDVLAHAMERVTGKRLPQIVSEHLWAPIGAEEHANFTVDTSGYGLSCGGFSATLRDLGRVGLAYLNDGKVGRKQVIPKAWVDDIRSGDHGLFNDYGQNYFPNGRYRNQFWIEDSDRTGHLCLGVFGQTIYVSPERGMVFVKLSTWPEFTNPSRVRDCMAAFHAIARALGRDL
ncbi:serine hydrolase domain-containing protein [Roseovarius aestuarii]|uniref:6-aminohexanoate-dimer hydrolase n=1 Tax=Roseovarius aestuarii TaxID=475083 RepID=A0A1X7BMI4_9RHOB|nr:serine hydrolase [Roseovarius aestuarii]SMC10852.1 6-aminohexanoate-dimer hydrolase [Roseovarius aestuarii]